MSSDLGTWIVFVLGIIVGGVLFSKDFRIKFFRSIREFLGQISAGAREMNRRQSGSTGRSGRRENCQGQDGRINHIQHIYKRTHHPKVCPTCGGSKRVYEKVNPLQAGAPGFKPKALDCPTCDGEGRIWD